MNLRFEILKNAVLQRGFPQRATAWLVIAMVCFCATAAVAQESAKDVIEPRLSRPQFVLLYRQLGLDSGQRSIAELMFDDYASSLDGLARHMDEEAEQAGLREVQNALAGRTRLPPEQLRAKRVAVLKVYLKHLPTVDKAIGDLIGGLESVLTPEQAIHLSPALREMHRSLYLHPRQNGSGFKEYAGDGVDVLMLVDQAMKDGGELMSLDRGSLHQVLVAYERQLDNLLLRSAAAHRDSNLLRKIATIEKDAASLQHLEQAALARWKELYELNQNAVRQIGDVAAALVGEDAQKRWLDRFDEASFEWLYPRKLPDRQIEWFRQQALAAEVRDRAEATYENYLVKRRDLSRQAIEIMLRGRIEFQTILHEVMDATTIDGTPRRPLFDQLLRNSGEQMHLEKSTSTALESLLNASQREAMRKATTGPEPLRRR